MARIDRAKNTLKAARPIRNLSSSPVFADSVGKVDTDDLYQLRLSSRQAVNFTTQTRRAVALQLFQLKGKKALASIGQTDFADLSRRQQKKSIRVLATQARGQLLSITQTLDAGTYYIRVYQNQGNNRYRLSVKTSTEPGTDNPISSPFLNQTWIRQFGNADNDYSFGTALDTEGDFYLAGVTTPTGAFNGSGLVAKYQKDGSSSWQRSIDLGGSTAVSDVAVDAIGNYYVVGTIINGSNSDAFLAKYDSAGQQQWLEEIESTFSGLEAIDAAAGLTLAGNDIYVTGLRQGIPALISSSRGQAFISKYDTSGNLDSSFGAQGVVTFGNTRTTAAADITVADGRVYLTGITDANLGLSGSAVNLSGGDAFVASFDRASGALLWNQTLSSGASSDYARGIAVKGTDVYIVGQTAGTLPSGSLTANTNAGGESDAFLAKYTVINNSGSLQWAKQIGGSGLDAAQAITLDAAGQIYLTGETNTSLFGTAVGGSDAWIAQADANGNLVRATQIGTARDDEAYSLAIDSTGALYVSGQTQGTFAAATSQNQGNYDIWLAKYEA